MLNTLRSCGLDKVEKNLLRKHLQPRDVLIALTFSSNLDIKLGHFLVRLQVAVSLWFSLVLFLHFVHFVLLSVVRSLR